MWIHDSWKMRPCSFRSIHAPISMVHKKENRPQMNTGRERKSWHVRQHRTGNRWHTSWRQTYEKREQQTICRTTMIFIFLVFVPTVSMDHIWSMEGWIIHYYCSCMVTHGVECHVSTPNQICDMEIHNVRYNGQDIVVVVVVKYTYIYILKNRFWFKGTIGKNADQGKWAMSAPC